jgi:hypothetical protein
MNGMSKIDSIKNKPVLNGSNCRILAFSCMEITATIYSEDILPHPNHWPHTLNSNLTIQIMAKIGKWNTEYKVSNALVSSNSTLVSRFNNIDSIITKSIQIWFNNLFYGLFKLRIIFNILVWMRRRFFKWFDLSVLTGIRNISITTNWYTSSLCKYYKYLHPFGLGNHETCLIVYALVE